MRARRRRSRLAGEPRHRKEFSKNRADSYIRMFLPGGKMPSSPAGKDACRHIFRQLSVSWTTAETGLILQQTDLLGLPTGWSDVPEPVSVNGQTNVVQQTMVTTNRFFRLHRP